MSHITSALSDAVTFTRDNLSYLTIGVASFYALTVASFILGFIPFFGQLINSILVVPFFAVGLLGMVYAGLQHPDEAIGVAEFRQSISHRYRDGVTAYGAQYICYLCLGLVFAALIVIPTFVFGVGGTTTGAPTTSPGAMAGVGLITMVLGLLGVLLIAAVAMVLQFIGPAVVIDNESGFDALRRSYAVARDNLLSVIGYSAVRAVLVLFSGGLVAAVIFATGLTGDQTTMYVSMALLAIFGPLVYAFMMAFHGTYYARLVGEHEPAENGQRA